jgi:hypothetical protein
LEHWPIYWDRVETKAGNYNWNGYDRLVGDDLGQVLNIDAILLGRPTFYADGDRIKGLQEPIFADGSDTSSPINRHNRIASRWSSRRNCIRLSRRKKRSLRDDAGGRTTSCMVGLALATSCDEAHWQAV